MSRPHVMASIDAAITESRVTVLSGLPRVGRSSAISGWVDGRGDAEITTIGADSRAPVRVIDHLSFKDVESFVDEFREIEQSKKDIRYVISPADLSTTRRLQDALAGSVNLLAIDPLTIEEFVADRLQQSSPAGPVGDVAMQDSPTDGLAPDPHLHWLRGGLPESLDFASDRASLAWRRRLIDSLLARDYSAWQITAATRLAEILQWIANQNGGELDESACPIAKKAELLSALHVFERLGLIRRLPSFPARSSASLGKKPRVFLRDSGLLHALLNIETIEQLRSHEAVGESWEGYAIESLISATSETCTVQFYRERKPGADGADEIDLVLDFRPAGPLAAIECKSSPEARPRSGFYQGSRDIGATEGFVVHSGPTSISDAAIERLDLNSAVRRVRQWADENRRAG